MLFCPKCKCEYQDWAKVCSDCDETLVDYVPEKIIDDIEKNITQKNEELYGSNKKYRVIKICPKCECEYQEWVEVCTDCNESLVNYEIEDISEETGFEGVLVQMEKNGIFIFVHTILSLPIILHYLLLIKALLDYSYDKYTFTFRAFEISTIYLILSNVLFFTVVSRLSEKYNKILKKVTISIDLIAFLAFFCIAFLAISGAD